MVSSVFFKKEKENKWTFLSNIAQYSSKQIETSENNIENKILRDATILG